MEKLTNFRQRMRSVREVSLSETDTHNLEMEPRKLGRRSGLVTEVGIKH
jgi:hypothetical protein